ncbi:hypothetical protein QV08_09085 [Gallibacterium salpingitidis]|uniref:Uncharacterized protein n=1 Tax=Gallibacterium salpingitidis TaxID=505341 RepID=A0AB36E0R5_9PAST|nr:hypothetical protein [Gallibacterium salpingitidis]OBX06836.1 hypothetical protein QV08_09085 [Gallibacterium salpingitidis]OBX08646.1 hypothetical protein QV09_09515 [Gallibacterium salpingitidis]
MNINYVLKNILGEKLGSSKILEFITELNSKFSIKDIDNNVYITFPEKGIELLFQEKKLVNIFFYIKNNFKYKIFEGMEDIYNIRSFLDNRTCEIINKGGGIDSSFGYIFPWILIKLEDNIYANVQYDNNCVKLISIQNYVI